MFTSHIQALGLRPLALSLLLLGPGAANAAITSLDLSTYTHTATRALPAITAAEASAVTFNWDTGTLFVLGDEGGAIVEIDQHTGAQLSVMNLSGFADTEGLTYVGGGQFVLTEERLRDAYKLNYAGGGSASRGSLMSADLGTTVGNIGIEGLSYDPRDGSFVTVKEKDPQQVNSNVITFGAPGSASITSLFTPASLGLIDLSDVQVLATVPSLLGGVDEDNLLLLSQESGRLVEATRAGVVLSFFDIGFLSFNAEGVTIDPTTGKIFIVAEEIFGNGQPTLFELSPAAVPLPAALPLLAAALAGLAGISRRQRSA